MLAELIGHASVINQYIIACSTHVQITNRNGQSHKDKKMTALVHKKHVIGTLNIKISLERV
jgi:hypothetical protein